MKPILQTVFGQLGNCFQACIASVLEIELSEVPNLNPRKGVAQTEQDQILNDWLAPMGLRYINIRLQEEKLKPILDGVYHLIEGGSPRSKNYAHVVVGRSGEMIFDPHPDKTGVTGFPVYGIFVVKNPGRRKI